MKKYLLILPFLFIASTALASNDAYQSYYLDSLGGIEEIQMNFMMASPLTITSSTQILLIGNDALANFGSGSYHGHFHAILNGQECTWDGTTYRGINSVKLTNCPASSQVLSSTSTNTLLIKGSNVGENVGNSGATSAHAEYLDILATSTSVIYRDNFTGNFSTSSVIQAFSVIFNWDGSTEIPLLPDGDLNAHILYPANSSSTFIHDFNYFTYSAENISSSTHAFNFRIVYDTTSTFDANPIVVSRNIGYGFAPNVVHYLNIPKPGILASSTTYYAKLCSLEDLAPNWTCGDYITFKTGGILTGQQINTEQAGWFGTSVAEVDIMYPTSTTDITSETGLSCGTEFYNPANWACWGAQRVVLLFNELKNFATGVFEMGFNFFLQVFPINVISQMSVDLHAVQVSTSTPPSMVFTGQGTAFKRASGGYYSFTFLTSSTLQASEARVGWNWEQVIVYLLWALCGIIIVGSAIALIKHAGHNSTPK